MKTKYLFLDRDGTIIKEPPDEQIDSLEKLEFIPGAIRNLYKLSHFSGYKLVMVTNQDGLGTEEYPQDAWDTVQSKLLKTLANEGVEFESIRIDTSKADNPSPDRKPAIGLIKDYLDADIDIQRSVVIGDRITDVEMAFNAGLKAVWFQKSDQEIPANLRETCLSLSDNWDLIFSRLNSLDRTAVMKRKTKETDITGVLKLNGSGESKINTGLGFFDHMLEQISRHGGVDLQLTTRGDLHVDEHHTIEDTGLALGKAFAEALQNKKGLARYGFYVPMDETLARCVLDFGGRPYLVWNIDFKREKIGDVPTEMFEHFFRSFAEQAKCNINISAEGKNEHHKIEGVFKAFARAIKTAISQDVDNEALPSTKGML